MRLAELTRDTWPSLEELFSANKTVGGCYCTWFMRTEVRDEWGEGNKITASDAGPDTWSVTCFFVHRSARGQGLARTLVDAAVDYARDRGARVVEGHPVDTEGQKRVSGDLYHGTLDMFLSAGFTLVERRGTRRALVRKEIP